MTAVATWASDEVGLGPDVTVEMERNGQGLGIKHKDICPAPQVLCGLWGAAQPLWSSRRQGPGLRLSLGAPGRLAQSQT